MKRLQSLWSLCAADKNILSTADVFRETGGARCAHNLVPRAESRPKALNIIEALILKPHGSSSDDDDMGTLLGLLSTVHPKDLTLKRDILKSLLKVRTFRHTCQATS